MVRAVPTLDVHRELGDCMKNGWYAQLPDARAPLVRCAYDDCKRTGFTVQVEGGQGLSCQCRFGDCAIGGADCERAGPSAAASSREPRPGP